MEKGKKGKNILVTAAMLGWIAMILFGGRSASQTVLIFLACVGPLVILGAALFFFQRSVAENREVFFKKEEELKALQRKLGELEYEKRQAQIRPHFLYNSLNTIVNICEKEEKKAGGLILDLSIFLQNSVGFNQIDKTCSIKEELLLLETYFRIEQARFGEKIKLIQKIKTDPEQKIPAFLLQPLVENAVRHGISKKPEGGTVEVRIEQKGSNIEIEIRDDGSGMPQECRAEALLGNKSSEGIGLRNIQDRLLYLYGQGLEVESEKDIGTRIRVSIPEEIKK